MLTYVAFLSIFIASLTTAEEPGLVLRLEQTGMNYVKNEGLRLLSEEVSKIVIPSISNWGSAKPPKGSLKKPGNVFIRGNKNHRLSADDVQKTSLLYNLTNIKIISFKAPTDEAQIGTYPGLGLYFQAQGVATEIKMKWAIKYGIIHDHGDLRVEVSDVGLVAGIQTNITKDGHLSIGTSSCGVHVGKISVHFSGNVGDELLNIFDPLIDGEVKKLLNTELCGIVNNLIQTDVVKLLDAIPVNAKLLLNFYADFSLTSPPKYGTDYAAISIRGEIYVFQHKNNSVLAPPPAPYTPVNNTMISIAITDYVFNSIGYVVGELLPVTISAAFLDQFGLSKFSAYLKTTCDPGILCLGTLLPPFGIYYPNSSVDVSLGITAPPTVSVDVTGLHLDLPLNISMTAESDKSGTPSVTFTVDQKLGIAGLQLNSGPNGTYTISGEIASEGVTVHLIDTKLPGLSAFALRLFMALVNREAIPILNNMFQDGIKIPKIKQLEMIQLKNSTIQYYDKTVVFGTSFKLV